jgi:hypothetical protein
VNISNLQINNFIEIESIEQKYKINAYYTPSRILTLNDISTDPNELIKIQHFNQSGISVGYYDINNKNKIIKNDYDYSIEEFEHYTDKNNFHHYQLIHKYQCCSKSSNTFSIIGLQYDEIDRNLFLDKYFDDICTQVFNYPTLIKSIDDVIFQCDSRYYDSKKDENVILKYGQYNAKIQSLPGIRKQELLNVPSSVKNYVDNIKKKNIYFKNMIPQSYLVMDDCISCS